MSFRKYFTAIILSSLAVTANAYNHSLTFNTRTAYTGVQDDYIGIPVSVLGTGVTGSNLQSHAITLGGWFRIQYPQYTVSGTQNGDAALLSINDLVKAHSSNFSNGLRLVVDRDTRKIKLTGDATGGTNSLIYEQFITDAVMPENEWHFVAMTTSNKSEGGKYTMQIYFDGNLVSETYRRGFTAWGRQSGVEAYFIAGGFGLNGAVDDIYIYDRCLSADEIKQLYSDSPVMDESIRGWYTFEEVVTGTTGQFANQAPDVTTKATYYNFVGGASTIRAGIKEGTADLTTITSLTQRPLHGQEAQKYALTISAPESALCTVTDEQGNPLDSDAIPAGTTLTLNFRNHYLFSDISVKLNGNNIDGASGQYAFVMPESDSKIEISATKNATVTMTVRDFGGGKIEITDGENTYADGDEVTVGTTLTFSATPDDDFYLLCIKIDGEPHSADETYCVPANDFIIYGDFRDNDDYNHALTFKTGTSILTTTEDRLDINAEIIGVTAKEHLTEAQFSIGAWVRQTTRATDGSILMQLAPDQFCTLTPFFGIKVNKNGELYITNQNIKDNECALNATLPLNEWHYLAFSVDMPSHTATFYFDGELRTTADFVQTGTATSASFGDFYLSIGGIAFSGAVDEVHVYNRLISSAEVYQAYLDMPESASGLVGWYKLETEDVVYTGKFQNRAANQADTYAVYNTLSGTTVDGGMIVRSTPLTTKPNLSTITRPLQRQAAIPADYAISIIETGKGHTDVYFDDAADNNALLDGEGVRPGQTVSILMQPDENETLLSLSVNGENISLTDTQNIETRADGSTVYHLTINAPTNIQVEYTGTQTSISLTPDSDTGAPTYFNIQGLRVAPEHLTPGIYIKKTGNHTSKILIR